MRAEPSLENALKQADALARDYTHEFITLDHLFLALLETPIICSILDEHAISKNDLRNDLHSYLVNNIEKSPQNKNPFPSNALERVLERAALQVSAAGRQEINPGHILVEYFEEEDTFSLYLLKKYNLSKLSVMTQLSHGEGALTDENPPSPDEKEFFSTEQETKVDFLSKFTQNLTELAKNNAFDPLVGRKKELQRVIQILSRRRKNNPVLVGDSGVGKTALIEGLSQRIAENNIPDSLKGAQIFSLDLASLLSGTKYRGDFEGRLKKILTQLKDIPKSILFIDEIHSIIGAGSTSGSSMDASNLLKPDLQSGNIRCIGSTTFEEYRKYFVKSKSFLRRFQKVDLLEPSKEDSIQILESLSKYYGQFHSVSFTKEAIHSAVNLSDRYIQERKLPDKAIDLLDEAGAANQLSEQAKDSINDSDIKKVISEISGVPLQQMDETDLSNLANLESNLKKQIFGQDEAVIKVTQSIKLNRSGFGTQGKPVASFLFYGPSGVGKTELAKVLAETQNMEFLRFDMSEYMESHSVSRLIGAPPGYVGYDEGGLLTEAVSQKPYSVVLLDEIEKAHPDIYNLLLQVMDHGSLTDSNGKKTDFQHVILILTSNVGARDMEKASLGFAPIEAQEKGWKALKKHFSPEFRNRLDGMIGFNNLAEKHMYQIIDKFLEEFQNQLNEKNIRLEVHQEAKEWILKEGISKKLGARPFYRIIQEHLKEKMVDQALFGDLSKGGTCAVLIEKGQISLQFKK